MKTQLQDKEQDLYLLGEVKRSKAGLDTERRQIAGCVFIHVQISENRKCLGGGKNL